MTDYSRIWSTQFQSGNRSNTFLYLERKALETYAVLKDYCGYSTEPVVDLGCGAGELLEHLLSSINIVKAVDYSKTMLSAARERLANLKLHTAPDLICEGVDILPGLMESVWISTGALSQYSSKDQLELIVSRFQENQAARYFVLFDTIDPVRYFALPFISYKNSYIGKGALVDSKVYDSNSSLEVAARKKRSLNLILSRPLIILHNLLCGLSTILTSPQVCRLPGSLMGYGVSPSFWLSIASRRGLGISILSSREFEYRYHVVISKG
jgi:hypothetical protein